MISHNFKTLQKNFVTGEFYTNCLPKLFHVFFLSWNPLIAIKIGLHPYPYIFPDYQKQNITKQKLLLCFINFPSQVFVHKEIRLYLIF